MEEVLHVHASHCLAQLNCKYHPSCTSHGFACIPFMHAEARRRHCSVTWVRQSRGPAVMHVTALLHGDGGEVSEHFEEGWHAEDASQLKVVLLQALKEWSLPVAVGAFVGSMIARQAFILVTSVSFLMCMIAHRVVESHGGHVNSFSDVFSRRGFQILLNASRSCISRIASSLPFVLTACTAFIKMISMHIYLLWTSRWRHLCCMVSTKQGTQKQHRDLPSSDIKPKLPHSAFDSESKSIDSIIHGINTCIQKLESTVHTEKGLASWKQLQEDLASLKATVATVPLKNEVHNVYSVDRQMTQGSTVKESVKSHKRNRKHLNGGKMQAYVVDNLTAHKSQGEKQHGLDGVAKIEDDICLLGALPTREGAIHSLESLALNGATSNRESGLLSRDFSGTCASSSSKQLQDNAATSNMDETMNGSSLSSNEPQPKHIDYWTQDNQNGSVLPTGSFEHTNNCHNLTIAYQRNSLVMADDQVTEGLLDFKEPKLYTSGKNFWIEEPSLSDSSGDSDQAKVSSTTLNNGNLAEQKAGGQEEDRNKSKKSLFETKSNTADHSVSLDTLDARPISIDREKTACSNDGTGLQYHNSVKAELKEPKHIQLEKKWLPVKTLQDQSLTQKRVSVSNGATHAMELDIIALGSCKELPFMREDPDMHALAGFSSRRSEKEFQRLMAEGEITFRNGKAGLLGKIEVGEAETMLCKAAKLFASAAALDSLSVEALGFWGNTLLVHGELKLMLSRELKHMICIPDVISSYQIRRSRVSEILDNRNRAALRQSFQGVCEECEELLIQAGRKYRMVLSISKSEIRALYNWGLALCFRAQLIAEEGGQNACDAADKVYLAAIDKFEAILGISRRYSPGALLNWGLILRDRSRLRPLTSPERIDLLQQAKQLFQDALRLQPDSAHIRSALTTCSVELKELQDRKELQSHRSTRSFFGSWY